MRRNKELTLEITQKCQLVCKWCSSEARPGGQPVSIDKLFPLLRQFKPYCNVVRLSGGEPLLHPQLTEILQEASYYLEYKVVLLTNGQDILPATLYHRVDEIVVGVANGISLRNARWYKEKGMKVSMQVVAVKGFEGLMLDALNSAFELDIPIRLLKLQKQGRGVNCELSPLVTWTGISGCRERSKITVTTEGKVVTCSALKARCEK